MFDTRIGLPRTLIETPRSSAFRQHCASPPRAESLTCLGLLHLLLRFESNGSHRHRRVASTPIVMPVTPPSTPDDLRALLAAVCDSTEALARVYGHPGQAERAG